MIAMFTGGQDVFVSLHTGYRKSVVYCAYLLDSGGKERLTANLPGD